MIVDYAVNVAARPRRWPWRRPIEWREVMQLVRALILRRVPRKLPINEDYLLGLVAEDLMAMSTQLWIFIKSRRTWGWKCSQSLGIKIARSSLASLIAAKRLRRGMMVGSESRTEQPIWGIYATSLTAGLIDFTPTSIQMLLDYLPVRNLPQLLAVVAEEAEGENEDT